MAFVSVVICLVWHLVLEVGGNATGDLTLEATPSKVYEGLTKDLLINCTFVHDRGSPFYNVMSLIVSKTDTLYDANYSEVASVTAVTPTTVDVKVDLGANVTGILDTKIGVSFLSFKWNYPDTAVKGKYRCEVFGMDVTGHPIQSTDHVTVDEIVPSFSMVLDMMRNMDLTIQTQSQQIEGRKMQLDFTVDEMTKQVEELNKTISKQNTIIADLNDQLVTAHVNAKLAFSQSAIIEKTNLYNGHIYFYTSEILEDVSVGYILCKIMGGYLVEIDDEDEYNFLMTFIKGQGSSETFMIGATDNAHHGAWTYLQSGGNLTFSHWALNQPDLNASGLGSHCMSMSADSGMYNFPCSRIQEVTRAMCELSEDTGSDQGNV